MVRGLSGARLGGGPNWGLQNANGCEMVLTLAGAALDAADAEIASAIEREAERQRDGLELIASENYPSEPVLAAMGSVLTNKYAEGYPGKRYYGGCEFVDIVEELAIDRAKSLFHADHANVQAHSGTQANIAAYFALLSPGDTAMGLELNHGGHLTHGLPVNISGRWFEFVSYGVDQETEQIDYDAMAATAREHRPKVIVVGATAYPRIYDFARAAEIAESVDATLMVDMAHVAGLVAGGVHPSPVPYAPVVTTTTHKTLRGPRSALILTNSEMARAIDRAIFPGTSGGPHMHTIAAKAVALKEAATPQFAEYAAQIVANACALADALMSEGWRVVSGGTDNHLLLLDVGVKSLTGKAAEAALDDVGITVNKNTIPYDTQRPTVTSGVRIGTPALTTRGMREDDMRRVAGLISRVLDQIDDASEHERVRAEVRDLAAGFPIPGISS